MAAAKSDLANRLRGLRLTLAKAEKEAVSLASELKGGSPEKSKPRTKAKKKAKAKSKAKAKPKAKSKAKRKAKRK